MTCNFMPILTEIHLGQWVGDNERLCALEPCSHLKRVLPSTSLEPGGPRSAIGSAPDSYVRGPEFDTRSVNILSFLLPLFQEEQLSVTSESMCTKCWLTA